MSATQTYSQTGLSASLRRIFPQRDRIVVVSIFGAEKKRHRPLSCFTYQFLNLLMAVLELRGVFLFKLLPFPGIVFEPFSQARARRDVLQPLIDSRLIFLHAARPESINQYATTVGFRWLVIKAFEPNAHVLLSQFGASMDVGACSRFIGVEIWSFMKPCLPTQLKSSSGC